MNTIQKHTALSVGVAMLAICTAAGAQQATKPDALGPMTIQKQGYFFVGGQYDDPANPTSMTGQMYVEYQIPADSGNTLGGRLTKYPIVMIHGGGHTGTSFQSRPDGGPGWADYFLKRGWPVYVVDRPGVAKSTSLGPFGNVTSVRTAEDRFSASEKASPLIQWPQANLHTQWPGTGSHTHGDPNFDQYYAHLSPGGTAGGENNQVRATVALLERIGPAILMPHSAPGPGVWRVADTRPHLVKAIVAVEPSGPPFREAPRFGMPGGELTQPWGLSAGPLTYDPPVSDPSQLVQVQESAPDGPGLIPCWRQGEPAHQLPRLMGIPIMMVLSEASYHAPYDHCTSKYLTQAGVANELVHLTDLGLFGNGHIMMSEYQNMDIARVMEDWLISQLVVRKD